ncbi:MAG: hypothetical protein V7709_09610 [Halioglobus sp.]
MKQALILLITFALIPSSFAQQLYNEVSYVFTVDEDSITSDDGECAAGIERLAKRYGFSGISPTITGKFKIHTFTTQAHNGRTNSLDDDEIGELLVCQDWGTYLPDTNVVPIYYEIHLAGRLFRVIGGMLHPAFPDTILPGGLRIMAPAGFPAENIFPVVVGGTVLSSGAQVSPGERGGVYSTNFIVDLAGDPDDQWSTTSHHVLRALMPVDE